MEQIDQHVESLIFTSSQPISEKELVNSLQKALDDSVSKTEVLASVDRLVEKYKSDQYAFEIVPISKGYHFMTKGAFHNTVGEHLKIISKKKLSRAALETLAIIAYKQPVTRIDLESIRGVGCEYTLQKLMEKELVEMQGRSTGPGRPLLYGTSQKFMDYFGIQDLKDLPKPKDFEMPESEVGEPAPIEVVVPTESTDELATEAEASTSETKVIATEVEASISEAHAPEEEDDAMSLESNESGNEVAGLTTEANELITESEIGLSEEANELNAVIDTSSMDADAFLKETEVMSTKEDVNAGETVEIVVEADPIIPDTELAQTEPSDEIETETGVQIAESDVLKNEVDSENKLSSIINPSSEEE